MLDPRINDLFERIEILEEEIKPLTSRVLSLENRVKDLIRALAGTARDLISVIGGV